MTPGERIERRQYLGASEVAAVIGMDPFKGAHDLWSEKMGLLGESEESEAAEMGKLLVKWPECSRDERPSNGECGERNGGLLD